MDASRRNLLKLMPALALAPFCTAYAEEAGQTQIRINIPGPHSLPFLPIELIPILGIDRGLNVQLIIRYFPSGVRALEDMLAGNAQFSAQGFTVLHAFHNRGKHVRAIAPLSGRIPPYGIVVRNDLRKRIKRVADLRGRSIGISVGNVISKTYLQQVMEVFLSANGVNSNEVRWVPTAQNWDGQFGALSSKSVDAVFCEEPFLTGLVRNHTGFILSDFSDTKVIARIPGAGHLRATLTTTSENLKQDAQLAALMIRMLRQSVEWIFSTNPGEIVKHLDLKDQEVQHDLIDVLSRNRGIYASDVRFSQRQVEDTAKFMRKASILTDDGFDLNTLIDSTIAGVKP
jgi:NitT/TauT family transport system substrate-binding protein